MDRNNTKGYAFNHPAWGSLLSSRLYNTNDSVKTLPENVPPYSRLYNTNDSDCSSAWSEDISPRKKKKSLQVKMSALSPISEPHTWIDMKL